MNPVELPEDIANIDRLNAGAVSLILARIHHPRIDIEVRELNESIRGVILTLVREGVLVEWTFEGERKVRYEPSGYAVCTQKLEDGLTGVGVNKTRRTLEEIPDLGTHYFVRKKPDMGGPIFAIDGEMGQATGFDLGVKDGRFVIVRASTQA